MNACSVNVIPFILTVNLGGGFSYSHFTDELIKASTTSVGLGCPAGGGGNETRSCLSRSELMVAFSKLERLF